MSFQISALPGSQFAPLFSLNYEQLASQHAMRMVADKRPGFPCRVSLADAEIGEEVILVHYEHQSAGSPFKASHAIFVRANAEPPNLNHNEIPEMFRSRIFSLRGFAEAGMLIAAELADGSALEAAIEDTFQNPAVDYIHLHFAKPGCYAARVDRRGTRLPNLGSHSRIDKPLFDLQT